MMSDAKLTLIIADDAPARGSERGRQEVRGPGSVLRKIIPRKKEVDLAAVAADLERTQKEIDALLGKIKVHGSGGFRLMEVEVSLAISAEGSIGVATAGVEAGIALTFAHGGSSE
jgi:hypothetical protein